MSWPNRANADSVIGTGMSGVVLEDDGKEGRKAVIFSFADCSAVVLVLGVDEASTAV